MCALCADSREFRLVEAYGVTVRRDTVGGVAQLVRAAES